MFQSAWTKIAQLVALNALHRKGFRLQEISNYNILLGARAELLELKDSPDDIEELADTFACLIHYAQRKGWTGKEIEAAILKKLDERFIK